MKSLWYESEKPLYCLAPMVGVTDTSFRRLISEIGKPSVFFTEFFSADYVESPHFSKSIFTELKSLVLDEYDHIPQGFPLGRIHEYDQFIQDRMFFTKTEQPLVAQIWGVNPNSVYSLAKLVQKKNFSGVDLNMGCPDPNVIRLGGCTALIKNRKKASELISATRSAVGKDFPLSVKTRIGFDEIETESWISFLLQQDIDVLTVHCRTVGDLSNVPNRWNEMKKIINLKHSLRSKVKIIGNGDITSIEQADKLIKKYQMDGVMIGRGIFKNPWVFNRKVNIKIITSEELIKLGLKHMGLFKSNWGYNNFEIIKRFLKIYVQKDEKERVMLEKINETNDIDEAVNLFKVFLKE